MGSAVRRNEVAFQPAGTVRLARVARGGQSSAADLLRLMGAGVNDRELLTRQEMVFDKEKLLKVYDVTIAKKPM